MRLTLRSQHLEGIPTDKVIYRKKLELYEDVPLERPLKLRTWTVAWYYGIPPIISNPVSLNQILSDADHLIEDFIADFMFANGIRE